MQLVCRAKTSMTATLTYFLRHVFTLLILLGMVTLRLVSSALEQNVDRLVCTPTSSGIA